MEERAGARTVASWETGKLGNGESRRKRRDEKEPAGMERTSSWRSKKPASPVTWRGVPKIT